MAPKRQSSMRSEKLKIIQFAEAHGNRAAQREFGESSVRLWRTSKEKLQKMRRLQRADHGRKAAWPRLKQDLMAWITEKWNNGLAILQAMVRLKAFKISKDQKYEIPAGQLKASNHWCQRFMKRNGLSLRQKHWPRVFPPIMKRNSCSFSSLLSSSEEPTTTHFILWETWTKVWFNLTCPQIELSVKLARKLWRFAQLETKRIAWQLFWHAQETVRSWKRWLFSNARPCPRLETNMALLLPSKTGLSLDLKVGAWL